MLGVGTGFAYCKDMDKWPATTAFLEGREFDLWDWTYRVWQGHTHHVLELKGTQWRRWFYTSGATEKWKMVALPEHSDPWTR